MKRTEPDVTHSTEDSKKARTPDATTPSSSQDAAPVATNSADEWKSHVLTHGDLEFLADNLVQVTGSLPRLALPRNMHVWKHPENGQVIIHSAICLDDERMEKLEEFTGKRCDYLIVPNGWHRADCVPYKKRYPDAKVVSPNDPRVVSAIQQVIHVDIALDAAKADHELSHLGVRIHAPAGSFPGYVYEFPLANGGMSLISCDLIFNIPADYPVSGIGGFITRYITASLGFFGVGRLGLMFGWFTGTNKAVKAWFLKLSERDDIHIVAVCHGNPVKSVETCKQKLKEASDRM